ncbi:hypothetical protein PDK93_07295 [Bacillus cereus]|uniref:DNA modification system-associated small protein n=1 Tax=Bacillus cereus group TaxID=86661 RepID=UPI0007E42048|nr:DNA modification system-associated small protein [Bacillus cereus]MDA1565875.1 hypothetical protein [Bacillus cereus]MDZ4652115.1 hypothetical protein [Bacillus cereus]HDR7492780.1 hypothetical protein [Bacillus cereus]
MHKDEELLLNSICEKYNINKDTFKQLFNIEKEFADRNLSRRVGIYNQLSEQIMKTLIIKEK